MREHRALCVAFDGTARHISADGSEVYSTAHVTRGDRTPLEASGIVSGRVLAHHPARALLALLLGEPVGPPGPTHYLFL